jgi:hypothetical protein
MPQCNSNNAYAILRIEKITLFSALKWVDFKTFTPMVFMRIRTSVDMCKARVIAWCIVAFLQPPAHLVSQPPQGQFAQRYLS